MYLLKFSVLIDHMNCLLQDNDSQIVTYKRLRTMRNTYLRIFFCGERHSDIFCAYGYSSEAKRKNMVIAVLFISSENMLL
jgi:hypothetical protein